MLNNIFKKSLFLFIIVMFVATTHFSGTASTINQTNTPSNTGVSKLTLLRINTTQSLDALPSEVEIVGEKPGEWIDIIVTYDRLDELSVFNYEVIIKDVIEHDNKVRGEYHTLAKIESILQNIADDYQDITSLYSIGKTYENRSIWCLEITDNPGVDEGEPGIVFTGLHHAREWPSAEICLYIADQLTSQYESNQTITDLVNNRRLWIVACVNPDGYHWDHDLGHDWRKNRQTYGPYIGVDVNRNYDGSCNGNIWGAWGSISSIYTSHDPNSEMYCGPSPFSEKESQAVASLFLDYDICTSLNWHTYGEVVLWPWGYTSEYGTPDNSYLSYVGKQIAQRITEMSGLENYTYGQSGDFYKNTGNLNDWSYGYGHYVQGRPTFSYTIEACSDFHPEEKYLDQVCRENFDGALYLLQEAENISKNVPSRVIPPVINDMTYDPDGDYIVTWEEQNPEADPDRFQLDELTDMSGFIDDVEDDKKGLFWRYYAQDTIWSSPAVANSKVYFGTNGAKIFCLNADNGNYIWSYSAGDSVSSSPTVADGKVYVGSQDSKIYCLDAKSGKYIWSYLASYVYSSPAVADGKVYFGSMDRKVYCLNANNGNYIWSYKTGWGIDRSSPAVAYGKVYIGSHDSKIYCLDAESGSLIWSYPTKGSIDSSPAVADGKVYIGSDDSEIYCLSADNGSYIWSYKTGGEIDRSSPTVVKGKVYIGSKDKKIYCLNADNGSHIWSYTTGDDVISSPAVTDGKVYIGSHDSKIYCLEAESGNLIWYFRTHDEVWTSPAIANGKLYIGSADSYMYCLSVDSRWSFNHFYASKSKSHSGRFSFYSGNSPHIVYRIYFPSMRTNEPVPIRKGMELSFWCWYDIDMGDKAFVEVSRDGRCYDIIDSFSGLSGDWIYKTYGLDSYEGESIFIRFRYVKHDLTSGKGFYVDDIMPIAEFDKAITLSESITSNQYSINGRPPGVYFYRVRGLNNECGWGDFSTIEDIYVGTTPPNKPTIDGPTKGKIIKKYKYTFSAKDPENHKVSYFINWGDGKSDGWTDYVESGTEIILEHRWNSKKTYNICAKAKDIYGAESDLGKLEVIIPRKKATFNSIFYWLLERFPMLERLLSFLNKKLSIGF